MANEQPNIDVLLADDHPLIMAGFAMTLAEFGVRVVGKCKSPEEAVTKYLELNPHVLVLDIRFGEKLTGFDAAKEVLSKFPSAKIVFLSQFDQDSLIKEAYKIGARAFVTKDCDPSHLAAAIQRASVGEQYFLPHVAERLANLAISGDQSPQSLLDEREVQVFVCLAQGMTNSEIAEKLDLSLKTISNISLAIKERLGVHRPADITRLAVKHRLIEP